MIRTRLAAMFAIALIVAICSASAFAQLPQPRLYALSQAGGQAGTTIDISIASGVDTDDARQLLFSHPGITATPKMMPAAPGMKPVKIDGQFTVAIGKDVPPGVYEVRVAGVLGVTNARAFVVGDLAEAKDPGSNRSTATAAAIPLNSVVNGVFTARAVNHYKIALKAGQRVLIDCKAERIDSRATAMLTLKNPAGQEVTRQRAGSAFDAMIDFTAPADGEYFIETHDLTYNGGDQYFYRLTARTGPYIDYIFPPAGLPGSKGKYTLYGRNLPGGSKSDQVALDGAPLEALEVEIEIPADRAGRSEIDSMVTAAEVAMDAIVYRLASPQGSSNPMRLGIARAPVIAEAEPNDEPGKAMKVNVPCEVAGRFTPRSDRDWFTFDAKKGQVLWIELFCQRIGVPADASLVIQQVKKTDKGEEVKDLSIVDDNAEKPDPRLPAPADDPSVRFTVPEDGTYRVQVRDQYAVGKPDPRRVYRLAIQPESKDGSLAGGATPDFRLVAAPPMVTPDKGNKNTYDPGTTVVRRGGADDLTVIVYRRGGFDGDIELSVEGLPEGLTCAPTTIGAGMPAATLVFKAGPEAAAWAGPVRVVGKAKINGQDVVREVRAAQIVWGQVNDKSRGWARLAGGLAVAVLDSERVPFTVTLGETKHELSRMGKVNVPVKVDRHDGFKGPVKVTVNAGMQNPPVAGKEVTIAADKSDGVIEVDVKQNAALQGYSLLVSAESAIQYARTPKMAEALTAQKKELDDSVKALTEESKKAGEASKAAAAAAKAADDAVKKAKPEQAAEAQKALEAANKAKADAEKAAKDAEDKLKMATEMAKSIDAQAKKATEAAKPKAVTLAQPVGTIAVRVLESPVKLEPVADVKLKAGDKSEQTVKLSRNSGFDGDVTFEIKTPDELKGVTLAMPVTAKKGEGEAKITLAATDKAAPGSYTITLRAKVSFGGQNLQSEVPVKVNVEK